MSGAKVLATDVWVDKKSEPVLLKAGKALPDWAQKLVTNPAALLDAPAGEEQHAEPGSYDGAEFTIEKLQDLLKERELPSSGNKPELKARLVADDAERAKKADEQKE